MSGSGVRRSISLETSPPLYLLVVVATSVGFLTFSGRLYQLNAQLLVGVTVVTAFSLSALAAYLHSDFTPSFLLGLLPVWGGSAGEAVRNVELTQTPLLHDVVHLSVFGTVWMLPLVILGFLVGAGWRYRQSIRGEPFSIGIQVAIGGMIFLVLAGAIHYSLISYSVQV